MQTLAFLWYELKAAKRHVKEAVAECQEIGKADFSLLNRPSDSDVIDAGPQGPAASVVAPDSKERTRGRERAVLPTALSAGVQPGLFRRRCHQLWTKLFPATDCKGVRHV